MRYFLKSTLGLFFFILLFISKVSQAGRFSDPNFYKLESVWYSKSGEKFKLCRVSSNGALDIVKEKKIKVHFREDKSEVTSREKRRLRRFFSNIPDTTFNIKMSAHADSCGDEGYNHQLAQKRGLNVYEYIKDLIPQNMPVSGENNGEQESGGHAKHDKFVEIIAEYWLPDEEFSQVVLFDISGSLHEKNIGMTSRRYTLNDLKQIKLKRGTIAYVPRDINYKCDGQNLSSYRPIGEDAFWEAMTLVTSSIEGKAVGYTYTDDTDPRGREKERILDRVNTNGMRWEIH